MRKLLCLLIVAGILAWPRSTEAATSQVYWYGCYRTTNGAHFANGLDHLCREYPIRRAHTRLTGYTRHCRQTSIRIEVYCVRYPTFYVPPPPQPPLTGFPPLVTRWTQYIYDASHLTGLPARFIAAVVMVESSGIAYVSTPGVDGADIGLMQFGPAEAAQVGGAYTFDPAGNIRTGSLILAWMYRNCAGESLWATAAHYNAGCGGYAGGYASAVWSWYAS